MKKSAYFASRASEGWPNPKDIEHFFLGPPEQRWFSDTGNDSGSFTAEGVDGTEHIPANKGRIDTDLQMWGNPDYGVLLIYSKWGGGHNQTFSSKGDLRRLRDLVRSTHDTPLPIGLFIPFAKAWRAVKEFIESDGELPKSIEWIANRDLPPNTFPDP
jgi:hypothetical protein